ncbi:MULTISPECIES: acyl-CoA thioesterase/bile acid-CoA:amino acid N-acyltransferase family protein [unclassified Leifsonia]|uniref:acyl-CoA thioesterase/bile acid-CoA:amino acid N-acyltransferase family protein n=1 Tax=unclassified Leifsonia TaxID=2663824 RepID=UPI0003716544|nr:MULTISPECIES: acyl-CoA thioesterase/BAAT N-terminal domain-containing protein [unclassified Leifsonia]TDQ02725.1 acyl-CoA thioester hydrolase/bile acid acetyltransferase-like protein [Leifsonia sp. 115AMFTsu3.1]
MRRRRGDGERHGMPRRVSAARRPGLLPRIVAAVASALVAVTALAGCATGDVAAGARFVTSPLVRYSAVLWPFPLELVGAEPGARLRLTARLATAHGTWTSAATYTVPASGTLDLASARPQLAPFTEPDSAGLFWTLRGPQLSGEAAARQWMRDTIRVTVAASDAGRVVASRSFELDGLASSLAVRTIYTRDLRPAIDPRLPRQTHEDVALATFYSAASLEHPQTPVVLMFDDARPGASGDYVAPVIAQFGASVLRIPVAAAADGVRSTGIVADTTVQAVFDWLSERPDIEQDRVYVYGTGAAEQLAVWAATRFPSRIHGLFVAGGAPALLCLPAARVAPVFEDSSGLPCLTDAETVVPSAVPSIDGVDGPVVLACGTQDATLPSSCAWQRALAATREPRPGDRTIYADGATHPVSVPPGLPIALPATGGQPTEKARIAFWNAVGRDLLRAVLG